MEIWRPTAQVAPEIGLYGLQGGLGAHVWRPTSVVDPQIGLFGMPPWRPQGHQDIMQKVADGDGPLGLQTAQIGAWEWGQGGAKRQTIADSITKDVQHAMKDPSFIEDYLGPVGIFQRQLGQQGRLPEEYVAWVETTQQAAGFSLDGWLAQRAAGGDQNAAAAQGMAPAEKWWKKPWVMPAAAGVGAVILLMALR